jgi:hypothetical protein
VSTPMESGTSSSARAFPKPPGVQAGNATIAADGRALIAICDDGGGAASSLDVDAWNRHACTVAGRAQSRPRGVVALHHTPPLPSHYRTRVCC